MEKMGISDLYKLIKETCPEQLSVVSLKEMPGYRISVDVSVFLYKFIRSSGDKWWVSNFFMFLCSLKRNKIKAVCIFDGPNPPPEKAQEQRRRRKQTEKSLVRKAEAEQIKNLINDTLLDERGASVPKEMQADVKRLIGKPRKKIRADTDWSDPRTCINRLTDLIERLHRQTLPITSVHKDLAMRIVKALGLGCLQAPGEAETLCAYLAINGTVDAVLTEDTDVLAYGTPIMLAYKDFSVSEEKMYAIHHSSLVKALEMDAYVFRDLCIMLSCDYNHRVKGFPPDGRKRKKAVSLGWGRSLLMIQEYGPIEKCKEYIDDIEPLKYERCRELLTIPSSIPFDPIPINSYIDEEDLENILNETSTNVTMKFIRSCWQPAAIHFEDTEESE